MKRLLPILSCLALVGTCPAIAADAEPPGPTGAGAPSGIGFRLSPPNRPGDYGVYMDPATASPANNCYPMINYIGSIVACAGWSLTKSFDNSWPYANANLIASQVTTSGGSRANAVALYGAGIANSTAVTGGGAWGLNTGGFTLGGEATAISAEIDAGMLVDPATHPRAKNHGVVIVSTGYYQSTSALQIQATKPGSGARNNRFLYGINLNGDTASNYGIYASNLHAANGLYVAGNMATAEIDFPDFKVNRTYSAGTARIQIDGSASGDPVVSAIPTSDLGPPANRGSVVVRGLGDGGVRLQDGSRQTVLQVAGGNTLGFYGHAPAARPTVSGNLTNGSALSSLLAALSELGLIANDAAGGSIGEAPSKWRPAASAASAQETRLELIADAPAAEEPRTVRPAPRGPVAWSPQVELGSSSGAVAYTEREGSFSCRGGIAYLDFTVAFTPKLGASSGALTIGNLPRPASSETGLNATGAVYLNGAFTWSAGYSSVALFFPSPSAVSIVQSGSGKDPRAMAASNLRGGASHRITGSITYPVDGGTC